MAKPKTNNKAFTRREIGEFLNNAVAAAMRPEGAEVPEERLRKLRTYAQALVEAPLEHVNEGLMRPEELVAVLAISAMFVHLRFVEDTNKLPAGKHAIELHKK